MSTKKETYYAANKEKFAKQYQDRREDIRAYWRNISPEVRQRKNQRTREWRAKNKERHSALNKKWREENPARWKELTKRNRSKPEAKVASNMRRRLREFIRTKRSSVQLFGCSSEAMRKHIEAKFTKGMTWGNYGEWHIDHIVPCSAFDLNNEQHVRTCFHFSNLRPLWATDNIAKSDRNIFPQLCLPL